jgi:predicted nucleic acid-binding protein
MILADTSVWSRHLRFGDAELARLLESGEVCVHPFLLVELASRPLGNRDELLGLLRTLPLAARAEDGEVLALLDRRELQGHGLGVVDLHLLASALITPARLWTSDRRLAEVARALDAGFQGRPA